MNTIVKWSEIESDFKNTILIGNGASISVDERFTYNSLKEYAQEHDFFNDDVVALFDYFDTDDFELILRLVWQARNVNMALRIDDEKTSKAYTSVRDSLIQVVRSIHPEHNEVSEHIPNIYEFLKKFKTVISLNYDLIIYWAMMYGKDQDDSHALKDCFTPDQFYENWKLLRQPYKKIRETTLVFYPHGNLILARNAVEQEHKLRADENDLLKSILDKWIDGKVIPLFVSEGSSIQKVNSIYNSYYLSTVYREVLPSLSVFPPYYISLAIYGWGFGEHDLHILKKIAHPLHYRRIKKIAVSVYKDKNHQVYCDRALSIIREIFGGSVEVTFFDSQSSGCWNN